jgi:F0F1-type ATP synthase assembly protein I
MSPFIFPIFRPFNLIAGFTTTEILYILSPNPSGMPFYQWYDWRKMDPPLDTKQVVLSVKLQLGWKEPSVFTFPLDTLNKTPAERESFLRLRAEEQFKSTVKGIVLSPMKRITKDLIVATIFAALFGYLFTVFPQVIPALPWVAAILLGLLVAFVIRRLASKGQ